MADAVANVGDAANQEEGGMWAVVKSLASRILMIYFVTSLIKSFTGGPPQTAVNDATSKTAGLQPSRNLFPPGQLFDMHLYLDESEQRFADFESGSPFWQELNIRYGDYSSGPKKDGILTFEKTFFTPEALLRNQSLYLHVFITKSGHSPNPRDRSYIKREVIHGVHRLNKYKKKHYARTANLLTGKSDQSEEDLEKATKMNFEILNFWHPNLTINLIDDQTQWTKGTLPPPLDEAIEFDTIGGFYLPILFFNSYWNLGSEYMPVNDTVKNEISAIHRTKTHADVSNSQSGRNSLDVSIILGNNSPESYSHIVFSMRNKWTSMLGGDVFEQEDDDQDAIKRALIETNPILLAVTVIVSLLHTVFEFLAFKNDIQFWRSRKDLVGLSVRSVLFNIFQSLIVFLYICDNDTNWVVKMSVGIGLLIECWKIPKVLNVEIDHSRKILNLPLLKFSDKGSYIESATKEYDQLAFKYLSWILFPLLGGYAVYSLLYVEQRGWYSWLLSMLYGFLLMFGFIMMTPQLFINYKLKSVAHLPWRMLTYKFINTFIDDLFAFVIRMPLMYRIGCFRDDIVFLVYVYQRWIYRVDPKRVNEFGTSLASPDGATTELKPVESVTNGEEANETKKDR